MNTFPKKTSITCLLFPFFSKEFYNFDFNQLLNVLVQGKIWQQCKGH